MIVFIVTFLYSDLITITCNGLQSVKLGRRRTTDFRSDWQVVSRSGRMSAIYLLTVFL
jgi:hypothetical protein